MEKNIVSKYADRGKMAECPSPHQVGRVFSLHSERPRKIKHLCEHRQIISAISCGEDSPKAVIFPHRLKSWHLCSDTLTVIR